MGGVATAAAQPPPEPERPPQGGGGSTGGQPVDNPAREGGGGQGDLSQPSAHRRPTAAGKRPVQAGSPGLSTPSKPKRGRGAAGAGTAGKAPASGCHRPTTACGLFALGFTRSTAVMPSGDEGKGRECAPPRGSEAPGKGHGRASSENTLALGAGPSLAPCTLRVRLGGRHGGSATSCFCADPCTHSVQDLNRLTCFSNFWMR